MAAVQALPPAPAAQTSPAAAVPTPSANPMATPWGAGALHQRLNSFVKKTLLQQLVPAGAVVCDLFCGRGVDTENWAEAQISKYVGVDLSASALEEAKEQWEKNGKPFAATFCELNPCMADLEKHLGENSFRADVVTCLAHLQDCFVSKDQVHCLLQNVSALLKPGGYFFGATPDSSTIWYKYQKAVEGAMKAGSLRANGQLPRVRTDLYSISFEDDRFHEYGSRYQLRFADESLPPQSQVLVHFPSLIRGAEEVGLEYVEIQNLYEFYEDYRGPFAETLQSSCGSLVDAKGHPVVDVKSRLSPVAQDVLSLYTTFIFKKPAPIQHVNPLQVPTPMSSSAAADIKKNGKKPSSSAVSTKSTAPKLKEEVVPRKKQRISSSTPEEGAPKGAVLATPEEIVKKKEASKPAPVAMKQDNSRSGSRGSKSLGRDPKTGNSHPSMSSSKAEERVSKVVDSPRAVAAAGVMTTTSGAQKHLESPLQIASKSKDVEQQRAPTRLESPNPPKTEDSKRESSRGANKTLKASDKPSSSRRRSESQQRSDASGRGNPETNPETDRQGSESGQSQDSLKRKREAQGGRSYTPASASAPVPVPSSGGDSNERTNVERRSSQRRTGFYSSPSEQQQQERGSNPLPTMREPASSHAGPPRGGDGDSLPKQAVNAPSASRTRETNAGRPQMKDVIAEHEESPPSIQKESSTTATTMEQGKPPGGSSSSHKRKIVAVAKEEDPVATPPQKELERLMGGDGNKAGSTTAAAAMEATSDGGAMMQAKEEAMAASEHPQKRERPVTELHYERRATQKRASANVNKVINKRESETMTTEAATQQPPPEREAATRKKATLVTTEAACFEGDDGAPTNSSGQVTPLVAATSQKSGLVSSDEHPPPDEKDVARKNETLLFTEGQLKGTKSQSSNEAMEVGLEKDRTALGLGPDEKRHPPPREPQLEELATIESGTNVGVGVLGVLSEKFIAASHDDKVAAQKKGGSVASDFVVEKRDHTVISNALPEKVLSQNREAFITAGGESHAEKGAKRRRESNALDQPLLEEGLSQMRESNVAMMKHSTQRTESSSVAMTMEPVSSVRGSNQVNLEILEPRIRRGFSPKRGGMLPGDSHSSRIQGITKESEAPWPETAPQRYTRRRAMAQAVEGGGAAAVPENPAIWQNNRGTTFGAAQIEREQQQQQQQSSTPVFHPGRLPPFVPPVPSNFGSLSRPPVRSVVDRRDSNSKSHDGPGLLGAAPPHIIINSQRERRYDSVVGPSSDPTMVARNRLSRGGPMFINKERGSRNPSEFANLAPHSSGGPNNNNNGPGMPWEEHMKGDSRSRNNR